MNSSGRKQGTLISFFLEKKKQEHSKTFKTRAGCSMLAEFLPTN
jgi:hypothetical protein